MISKTTQAIWSSYVFLLIWKHGKNNQFIFKRNKFTWIFFILYWTNYEFKIKQNEYPTKPTVHIHNVYWFGKKMHFNEGSILVDRPTGSNSSGSLEFG